MRSLFQPAGGKRSPPSTSPDQAHARFFLHQFGQAFPGDSGDELRSQIVGVQFSGSSNAKVLTADFYPQTQVGLAGFLQYVVGGCQVLDGDSQ